LLCWLYSVPSESVWSAFLVSQFMLFLLLIPRFWQRGVAVWYWQQRMMVQVEPQPVAAETASAAAVPNPVPEIPGPRPTQAS
jgi:hypothetical protein